MAGSYWDKYTQRRISRRRALQAAGAAGTGAAAIWIVGCGGDDGDDGETPPAGTTPGTTTEPGTPVRGGTYRVGSTADFDTFDPYIGIAASVGYFPRLYNVLVNFSAQDSDFRFDDLSTSFEQPDDVTYNFTIRPGVKVGPNSLGVPERDLTAEDVQIAYERIKTLPASNAFAFIGQWMETNQANPDGTYTFKTPRPYFFWRNRIGSSINTIVPKEALEDAVIGRLRGEAAGAGPFTLERYAEGEGALLRPNPNYYLTDNGEKLPYIDALDVKIITERATLRTAFQSDQIDSYGAENKDEADQLGQGKNYTIIKDPANTFIAFTMNPTREPWADDRIRKAALHAINRQEYIDRIYGGEAQANGLVHWSQGEAALPPDELERLQPYDPQQSRELIRAATGQDTIRIKVMYPAESAIEQHNQHLPIWREQMAAAGFELDEDPQPFATWLDNYTKLEYDCSLALNQIYEYPEFNMDFQHSEGPARNNIYATGVGRLYPEIDAEIDRVKGLTDAEEFYAAIKDLQRLIYEKGPTFIPFVTWNSFTLYHPRVKNIPTGLGGSGLFVNTWYLDG
jgi:peptide/nickel transport system substrate-binding protein